MCDITGEVVVPYEGKKNFRISVCLLGIFREISIVQYRSILDKNIANFSLFVIIII